jgi:two-component system cell cycle sensor histidine kinase/response regulator CckA
MRAEARTLRTEAEKDRILLVDDEPQVLLALEDLLSDQFIVHTADSAATAIELVQQQQGIAVVVSDQRMPRMGGDELLAIVRGASSAERILITGFADLSAVIRAVNDGKIFAYVTKPWNPEDVKLTVGKAVEHFRLARELAEERQLLHDLMDNIPDGIYFKDLDLRFRRANRSFASMVSAGAPETLVGKRLSEVLKANGDLPESENDARRVLAKGEPAVDVVRRASPPGGDAWFSETQAPIRSAVGDTIGVVGIWRDVSDRVWMETALRESEGRLREQSSVLNSILDSMGDGVVVTDRSGRLLLFNRQAERLLGGRPPEQLSGNWAEDLGICVAEPKTRLSPERDPLHIAVTEERTVSTELLLRNSEEGDRVLHMTASPLRDAEQGLSGGVALLRDVTQERELERQLMQSQKMEAIGRLAGGVAHDFNNLLSVIQSYAELLMMNLEEGDERREDVGQVLAASHRAASLTRQLLAFCRRQVIQPKLIQLNVVVSEIEKMLQRIIGEDIALVTSLAPTLGTIKADQGQLEQIIVNLTVNARDAMPNGGRLSIETRNLSLDADLDKTHPGVASGDYVVLSVRDNGTGMSAATQKRIFEPFFTTKDVGKGTGLGLSMVYGIVQQSAGHISVDSELGSGTSFEILFQRVDEQAAEHLVHSGGTRREPQNASILVVDDNEPVRRVAARILRDRGYKVFEAADAREARTICATHGNSIDLLLLDVVMPEVSGPHLAAELEGVCPRARVLFMSGYSGNTPSMEDSASWRGEYLEKPFTPAGLEEKVQQSLAPRD